MSYSDRLLNLIFLLMDLTELSVKLLFGFFWLFGLWRMAVIVLGA